MQRVCLKGTIGNEKVFQQEMDITPVGFTTVEDPTPRTGLYDIRNGIIDIR